MISTGRKVNEHDAIMTEPKFSIRITNILIMTDPRRITLMYFFILDRHRNMPHKNNLITIFQNIIIF